MRKHFCLRGTSGTISGHLTFSRARAGDSVHFRKSSSGGRAVYTQLSVRTLAELVAEGKLRPARVGRRVLLDTRDLDRFLDECKG